MRLVPDRTLPTLFALLLLFVIESTVIDPPEISQLSVDAVVLKVNEWMFTFKSTPTSSNKKHKRLPKSPLVAPTKNTSAVPLFGGMEKKSQFNAWLQSS